jgi:uncharacterized membrane protein YhaH (DUF805 family)
MAYGDIDEEPRGAALARLADLKGRGRRLEAGAVLLVFLALPHWSAEILSSFLPWQVTAVAEAGVRGCLGVLLVMATIRRLHDQDRSGRWAALLVAGLLLLVPDYIDYLQMDWWEIRLWEMEQFHWLQAAAVFLLLPYPYFLAVSGTIGPNRYGRDPREDPVEE